MEYQQSSRIKLKPDRAVKTMKPTRSATLLKGSTVHSSFMVGNSSGIGEGGQRSNEDDVENLHGEEVNNSLDIRAGELMKTKMGAGKYSPIYAFFF